jgi:GTPase
MEKETKKPAEQPTAPKQEPTKPAPSIETLAEQIEALNKVVTQQQKRIAELEKQIVKPDNYAAVLFDLNRGIVPVHKNGDANGDGFTSFEEALAAARQRIAETGLSGSYVAGVFPTWDGQ